MSHNKMNGHLLLACGFPWQPIMANRYSNNANRASTQLQRPGLYIYTKKPSLVPLNP